MPLAMRPLRDQMAHCRRTTVQPSALTRSPRRSRGLMPCERLVSGSTSNEITSCQATLARSFRYFVFERVFGALKDTLSNYPLITPAAGAHRNKGDAQNHKTHGLTCVLRGVKLVLCGLLRRAGITPPPWGTLPRGRSCRLRPRCRERSRLPRLRELRPPPHPLRLPRSRPRAPRPRGE